MMLTFGSSLILIEFDFVGTLLWPFLRHIFKLNYKIYNPIKFSVSL